MSPTFAREWLHRDSKFSWYRALMAVVIVVNLIGGIASLLGSHFAVATSQLAVALFAGTTVMGEMTIERLRARLNQREQVDSVLGICGLHGWVRTNGNPPIFEHGPGCDECVAMFASRVDDW